MHLSLACRLWALAGACLLGCASADSPTTAPVYPATPEIGAPPVVADTPIDDAHGGRLYDAWYTELASEFEPRRKGGPHGDGTLDTATGSVLPDEGHGYRLKNLFGWDLRGSDGIYGPQYQNRADVRGVNLLADSRTVEELEQWLARGDDELPALGPVIPAADLHALAVFIDRVRTGELPHPDRIWTLSTTAPNNYVLNPGGDAARGKTLFADACAGCHGPRGEKIVIDEVASLGAFSRTKAYEGWFKMLNGHPGSPMERELAFSTGTEGASQIRDLLAALCDRQAFPALAGQTDVPDGDPRCGAYLR
jgi:hypothetical protein